MPIPCHRPGRVLDMENRHDLLVHRPTVTAEVLWPPAHEDTPAAAPDVTLLDASMVRVPSPPSAIVAVAVTR